MQVKSRVAVPSTPSSGIKLSAVLGLSGYVAASSEETKGTSSFCVCSCLNDFNAEDKNSVETHKWNGVLSMVLSTVSEWLVLPPLKRLCPLLPSSCIPQTFVSSPHPAAASLPSCSDPVPLPHPLPFSSPASCFLISPSSLQLLTFPTPQKGLCHPLAPYPSCSSIQMGTIQGTETEQPAPSGSAPCFSELPGTQNVFPRGKTPTKAQGQIQELSITVSSTHHPETATGRHSSWRCWLTVPSNRSAIFRVFRAYLTALSHRTNASWQSQKWWKIWSLSQAKMFRNNVGG